VAYFSKSFRSPNSLPPLRRHLFPSGATWAVYAWTHVESDGPTKYVGRSMTYPDGPT
jgi:hypothetical protein